MKGISQDPEFITNVMSEEIITETLINLLEHDDKTVALASLNLIGFLMNVSDEITELFNDYDILACCKKLLVNFDSDPETKK
jgi:hypothetical protein